MFCPNIFGLNSQANGHLRFKQKSCYGPWSVTGNPVCHGVVIYVVAPSNSLLRFIASAMHINPTLVGGWVGAPPT